MALVHKSLKIDSAQLKFDDSGRKFSGYASVFGGVDSYGDTVFKGAYEGTLADRRRLCSCAGTITDLLLASGCRLKKMTMACGLKAN